MAACTRAAIAGLVSIGLLGLNPGSSVRGASQQSRSTRNGVYTLEQASRGQQQYDVFCVSCHGPDMEGSGVDVPALIDERFLRKWSGRPLRDLFDLLKRAMPENAPGSLSDTAYADALSLILQANGFPSGSAALEPDRDQLSRITFEEPESAAR